jgi:arginine decarboxylase-like protein
LARTAEVGAAVATNGVSLLPQLIRTGRLKASDAAKLETVKNQEALAKDLAPILMETDPKKAREALNDILDRVDTYNRKSQQTRRTGASVGAAVGTGILAEQ